MARNTFKKGYTPWNKGKKGIQVSARKGVKLSIETRLKISKSRKGKSSFAGKKHTPETKEKIRATKIERTPRGKYSHMWKDGRAKINKIVRRLNEYLVWRSDVFERDKWSCQTCGTRGVYVTAHHIKSFSSILKEHKITNSSMARKCSELWDINNGVTLCEPCHSLTDNYRGRANKKHHE